MEDLSDSALTINVGDGYRMAQILSVTRSIAKLHAYSLTTREWNDKFVMQPKASFEEWGRMYTTLIDQMNELHPTYFKVAHSPSALLGVPISRCVQGKIEKLEWLFNPDLIYHLMGFSHVAAGLPTVFVHGDLWANNMLFPRDDSQENGAADELAAFIDWQGPPSSQLPSSMSYFLHISSRTSGQPHGGSGACRLLLRLHPGPTSAARHPRPLPGRSQDGARSQESGLPSPPLPLHSHPSLFLQDKLTFSKADLERAWDAVLPFSAMFVIAGLTIMVKSPAIIDGEKGEERKGRLLLSCRDLIDDVIRLYPNGVQFNPADDE